MVELGMSQMGWHVLLDCVGHEQNIEIGLMCSLESEFGFGFELACCSQFDNVIKGIVLRWLYGRSDMESVLAIYS